MKRITLVLPAPYVGLRPFIKQRYGQRKKVSVIGALALSPDRRRNPA